MARSPRSPPRGKLYIEACKNKIIIFGAHMFASVFSNVSCFAGVFMLATMVQLFFCLLKIIFMLEMDIA